MWVFANSMKYIEDLYAQSLDISSLHFTFRAVCKNPRYLFARSLDISSFHALFAKTHVIFLHGRWTYPHYKRCLQKPTLSFCTLDKSSLFITMLQKPTHVIFLHALWTNPHYSSPCCTKLFSMVFGNIIASAQRRNWCRFGGSSSRAQIAPPHQKCKRNHHS